MSVVRAVWRYRWEIAPFLLIGMAQSIPLLGIALLHSFGFSSSARWTLGRFRWDEVYAGDVVWSLFGIGGVALLFVLLRHGTPWLEGLHRPVTKALWEALLLLLAVSWVLEAAANWLDTPLGFGVRLDVYQWFYLLFSVLSVGWAVRTLWNASTAPALFVVVAVVIVRGSGVSGGSSVSADQDLLWFWVGLLLVGGAIGQMLLFGFTGALAHHLAAQPVRRQWLMTGGLFAAASAVLVAGAVIWHVAGARPSVPFWYAHYCWDYALERDFVSELVANLVHLCGTAALAAVTSLGFHTLLFKRQPVAEAPPVPPSEHR